MKRAVSFLLLAAGTFLMPSCKTQKVPTAPVITCEDPKPTYSSDIKPILDANCATTCHSKAKKAAGIDLSSYNMVKTTASKRKFLGAIRHERGFASMPRKAPKLSESDIHKIACWVQNGMLN